MELAMYTRNNCIHVHACVLHTRVLHACIAVIYRDACIQSYMRTGLPYRCLWKNNSSGEEDPLEDRLSEHQIRGWGWNAASAAGLLGQGSGKRCICFAAGIIHYHTSPHLASPHLASPRITLVPLSLSKRRGGGGGPPGRTVTAQGTQSTESIRSTQGTAEPSRA